ncbi:MAG: CRTAC1 family protein [Planctomycetota bacterium]|nr:CRTAC1 family protein [Planctomycetota bacterium]
MPRSRGPEPCAPLCASLLALLAACSDRTPDTPGVKPAAPAPVAAPAFESAAARQPRAWFPGRVGKLPAWSDELRARLDPRRDGWASEATCVRLEAECARALEAALRSAADLAPLRALGTAELSIPRELLPSARATLLDGGGVHAEEARVFPAAADLDSALAGWRTALAVGADPRCEVAFESWTQKAPGRFEARIAVRASAAGSTRVQTTLELDSFWTPFEGGARLVQVEPRSATVVVVAAPLVVDATEGALVREPWFASDLLIGTDARHGRRDRLGLDPFLGMQGIAIGDVDGDGLEDVYVCQSTGLPNRLLRHAADGTAHDVALEAGVAFLDGSSAALFADLDGDGDEDLGVATGNVLLLAWNDGHGRFPEGSVLRAPDAPEIYSVAAADVDLDGDLDLYACRYVEGGVIGGAPAPYHDAHNGAKNLFWRNEGSRNFRECATEVGLDAGNDRFSLAAVFEDFDDDGDADLYVTNDFGRNNLYVNAAGHFTDVAASAGAEDIAASMGAAVGDVDQDGDLDLYVTNMESPTGSRIARDERFLPQRPADRPAYVRHARGNSLLRCESPLRFSDALESSGARRGGWAWGSTFTDWNADGLPDVFVPNGFVSGSRVEDLESFFWRVLIAATPTAPPPTEKYLQAWQFLRQLTLVEGFSWNGNEPDDAYLNVGDGRFVDASRALGLDFTGDSRSAVRCDWDGDQREDLWVGARTGPRLRLLLAAGPTENQGVTFELVGTRSNRQGIGATVLVEAGGRTLRGSARVGDGYLSSSSKRIVIALGSAQRIDAVRVRWPGGKLEEFAGVEPGSRWRLVEGQGQGRAELVATTRGRPASRPSPWIPAPAPGVGRIVLDDRLPIGVFELADLAGKSQRVETFAGRALVVAVGRAADPETAALCDALAAHRTELEASGIATWALAIAEPGQEPAAREVLEGHGQRGRCGLLDARASQALEVLLVEVLGPFEKIPLPMVLVIDRGGSLALVRCGPVRDDALLADARAVARLAPERRGTEALVGGGRWARVPERALGSVADVFDRLGRPDWAAWYRERARTRTGR